jgi:hypothetical protein
MLVSLCLSVALSLSVSVCGRACVLSVCGVSLSLSVSVCGVSVWAVL